MKKALSLGILFLACGIAAAQTIPVDLYAPARSIKDQKITLVGWGSGTIAETDGVAFAGTTSIRVSSRNFFQGGTMVLGQPVDLAKKFDDKTNLLDVTFFLEDAGWVYGVIDKNADKGGGGGGLKSRGGGAARFTGGTPSTLNINPSIPFKPKITSVRLILTTTDDKRNEGYFPVGTSQSAVNALGWRNISVPLQAINGFDRTNKIVKGISVYTDTYATM